MDERLLELMAKYDAAAVGSPERAALGHRLEKEGARLSEHDYWKVVAAYRKRIASAEKGIIGP